MLYSSERKNIDFLILSDKVSAIVSAVIPGHVLGKQGNIKVVLGPGSLAIFLRKHGKIKAVQILTTLSCSLGS